MGHWDTNEAHSSKTGKHAEDQKFPTGLLPEGIQSVSNALATLHGRPAGATFLLILLQLRSPRTPEKRNTSGTQGQCVPTPHVGQRLLRTLYLHNLIRSGKLEPVGAGELSRTVCHCSFVACAGRMVGGGLKPM